MVRRPAAALLPLLALTACVPYGFTPAPGVSLAPGATPGPGAPLTGAAPTPAAVALSAKGAACTPSNERFVVPPTPVPGEPTPDPGQATPAPVPFSFTVAEGAGFEGVQQASIDGAAFRFQENVLLVALEAPDESWHGPMGDVPGVLGSKDLIAPVLNDFQLDAMEQMRLPVVVPSATTTAAPAYAVTQATPAPEIDWKLKPNFLTVVRNPEAEPLDSMASDAQVLGFTGKWAFQGRAAAGTFARMLKMLRRRDCYAINSVALNTIGQAN